MKQRAELRLLYEELLAKQMQRYITRADYLLMLEALLGAGANPDTPWDNGTTMLMWAGAESVPLLVAHGADLMARDIHGETALHLAREKAKVTALLSAGAVINVPASTQSKNARKPTPLQTHLVAEGYGLIKKDVVDTLLMEGADPLQPDGNGVSTLAYLRNGDRYDAFVSLGLDPLARQPGGGTLIHMMAEELAAPSKHSFDVVDHILQAGVDINARDNRGRTALHEAALQNHVQEAGILALLKRGANPNLKDKDGLTPADLIPSHPVQDSVRKLLFSKTQRDF